MNTCYQKEDKLLMIELLEEIDHHSSEKIRRRVDYEIQRYLPRKVVFDFGKVPFMDSAGIGMLVGRYRLVTMLGGSLELTHVKSSIKKILSMSGVLKIISIVEEDGEEDYERTM